MFADMLERDRQRAGLTVGQTAWRLDMKPREYVAIESGDSWPDFDTYDRICKLLGWPQSFSRDAAATAGYPTTPAQPKPRRILSGLRTTRSR
jgi:DNA-binding XRE family transcriptional regulator